ncbi:hypothetical protein [Halosegnis sp.]|uniref:hypothetical protein n=1 Tax=Halosegnis sp. TaxID=2864959 RepID=UPI0035D3FFD9
MTSRRRLAALAGGIAAASAVGLSWWSARGVPLSPLHGDARIGPEWPDRHNLRGAAVDGEMESLDAYARPGFDPNGVDPVVRALYEQTADFEMTLDATWHRPFRLGARLAARVTARIEQLALPAPGDTPKEVESDLAALAGHAAAADPRDGPRLWVRTDRASGSGVFVAVYGSHLRDGERLVNVAVPLPGCSLATVLRVEHAGDGLALTTDCPDGGLYLHTKHGGFRLPAGQRFRVAPASDPTAPAPPDSVDPQTVDVLAVQRIRLCGLPLVTVRYAATQG